MTLPSMFMRTTKMSVALALFVGLGLAAVLRGQGPAPAKFIVKNSTFHLPFKLDRGTVNNVREMHLWMRDGAGQWRVVDRVPPTANHFTCSVAQDGEYGFSIVTVDMRGLPTPTDVTKRPPELTVVVEAHGKPAPGIAKSMPTGPATANSPSTPPAPFLGGTAAQQFETVVQSTDIAGEAMGPKLQSEPAASEKSESAEGTCSAKAFACSKKKSKFRASDVEAPVAASQPTAAAGATAEDQPSKISFPCEPGKANPASVVVNNTHVCVDYNVNKVGPSGISKLLIYITTDGGQTWKRHSEDSDLHSPADIDLPGEGVFGIRLVGINGNGFGGKAPAAGDAPCTTIEVDQTKPVIQGWKVKPAKNGDLEIYWKATDKNLTAEPINLYYRTQSGTPWKPMALKVKNDGIYHWPVSRDLAAQYYVKIEAVDMAGNISTCETASGIMVDRTEPDINVTGISVVPHAGNAVVPTTSKDSED
jgi:hypothetical protein